jgi:hypothetical protein
VIFTRLCECKPY